MQHTIMLMHIDVVDFLFPLKIHLSTNTMCWRLCVSLVVSFGK